MKENYFKEDNCIFCGKLCKNQNSLKQHQIRCKLNPNRIKMNHKGRPKNFKNPGTWKSSCTKRVSKVCPFCNELKQTTTSGFTMHIRGCKLNPNRMQTHLKEETRIKLSKILKGRTGGYRMTPNSTRSHRGYYKGIYCMSSWELAFVAYQIDQGKIVKQCTEKFPYMFEGKKHLYTPDFIIDGVYYEIKNWHRPETDSKLKYFPSDKKIILIEGIEANKTYVDYVKSIYGENFWEVMYDQR